MGKLTELPEEVTKLLAEARPIRSSRSQPRLETERPSQAFL